MYVSGVVQFIGAKSWRMEREKRGRVLGVQSCNGVKPLPCYAMITLVGSQIQRSDQGWVGAECVRAHLISACKLDY